MTSMEEMRERVAKYGKTAVILEEMLRLGFLTKEDLTSAKVTDAQIQATLSELRPVMDELAQVRKELYELGDLQTTLKEIRRERIAQRKALREVRKIEKERNRVLRQEAWEVRKRKEAPFLGVGVSHRLQFEGGDIASLRTRRLPVLDSLADIAEVMKITTDDLVWLCYERGATEVDHYTRFEIPKRSGGKRLISSPKPKMRVAQSWINQNILNQLEPSQYCYAFRPATSIVDNASQHVNKSVILKLDIKDFFPSITFSRVRGYFEYLGYNPGVATVLALLCTDAPRSRVTIGDFTQIVATGPRGLPQGACTSPALANLIASRLDSRLAELIATFSDEWTYTRYADDLTFSTTGEGEEIGQLIAAVTHIASDESFEIKREKTRIMRSSRRQSVTGLLVGDEVRIPKETIRKMRALFHNIETKGEKVVSEELEKNALNVARGYWAYLHMVMPEKAEKYLRQYSWLKK
jgi:RNA-directed DNA polymerase